MDLDLHLQVDPGLSMNECCLIRDGPGSQKNLVYLINMVLDGVNCMDLLVYDGVTISWFSCRGVNMME